METIEKRIQNIKEELSFFDNELEKYEYIIDLGKKLEGIDESLRDEKYLVQGCTSLVWLIPECIDGKIYFRGDSDAMIVKGLVYIIISIFEGIESVLVKDFNTNLLEKLELKEIITPNRQSGVAGMLGRIKEAAEVCYGTNR